MTVYRQIYQRVRTSIEDGMLRAGDRLPSARALASEMGVARGTVDAAYALLSGEGYVISKGRGGTIVSPELPVLARRSAPPGVGKTRFAKAHDAAEANPTGVAAGWTLIPGVPSLDLFPRKLWSQLVARQARRMAVIDLAYPDPAGSRALREAIAAYLAVARGINCSPDQILVTGGYQAALGLLFRHLVGPGADVWIEDPGYPPTRRAIEAIGANPVPVPVDAEGLDVEAGQARSPNAALAIVTPAHQYPLGVSFALPRRLALLEWAKRTGGWILEDDYDGEFRNQGRALPALKSLDRDDRVFYVGTFSKTLFPGLRLGYVVAPAGQAQPLADSLRWLDGGRAHLEQAVVAALISEGHFARHLKKMRTAYDSRRTALTQALAEVFDGAIRVDHSAGGLHLVARLSAQVSAGGVDDRTLVHRARLAGLQPYALSPLAHAGDYGQALLIGFANTPERLAPSIAQRLRAAIL